MYVCVCVCVCVSVWVCVCVYCPSQQDLLVMATTINIILIVVIDKIIRILIAAMTILMAVINTHMPGFEWCAQTGIMR